MTDLQKVLYCLTLALLCGLATAYADVVVLESGGRMEGRVTPAPGDPDAIVFEDSRARIKIARSRIREIREDSDAVDFRMLGDQYLAAKRYGEAREAYEQAKAAAPDDGDIARRIEALDKAVARARAASTREELQKVDELIDSAFKHLEAGEFDQVEEVLKDKLPEEDQLLAGQREKIASLRKKLYRAWGLERLDKLDSAQAAEYFERYLKLNPGDEEVYDHLIDIYDEIPEKNTQVIEAHRVRLQLAPNDRMTRKKLADKYLEQANLLEVNLREGVGQDKIRQTYEKAAEQYEILYKSGDFKRSEVERRLVQVLRALRERSQQRGDLDGAIAYHKRLPASAAQAEQDLLHKMEYARDLAKLNKDDVAGRIALIERLESQGIEGFARQRFEELRAQQPNAPEVVAKYKKYGMEALANAQGALHRLQYESAMTQATTLLGQYGKHFEDIRVAAEDIRNKARVQLEKERRRSEEEALKYKALGDRYFSEGKYHMDAMLSTERRQNPEVLSDKQEAIRNFQLAVQNYGQALDQGTGLDDATRAAVRNDRQAALDFLSRLQSTYTPPLPGKPNRLRRR